MAGKINWRKFAKDIQAMRDDADIGLREAARSTGITHSAWCRAEQGKPLSAENYLAFCAWMASNPYEHFTNPRRGSLSMQTGNKS